MIIETDLELTYLMTVVTVMTVTTDKFVVTHFLTEEKQACCAAQLEKTL